MPTIKHLTKKQKAKSDKVIKLLEELSKEGITFYMNSTPQLQIGFCRTTDNIDFDVWSDFTQSEDYDKFYSPLNNIRLESYAY